MYSFYDYMPRMAEGGQPQEGGEDSYAGMAMGQLAALQDKAAKLREFLSPDTEIDPWVASKITLADDYLNSVVDYMQYNPEGQGEGQQQMMPPQGGGQEEMPNPGGPEPNGYQEYPEGQEPQMKYGGYYQTGGSTSGGKDDQVAQIIQAYAEISGAKPEDLVKELQGMKPAKQKQALKTMLSTVQKAMSKQQSSAPAADQSAMAMQQQPMDQSQGMMMRQGGYISHDGSYRPAKGTGSYSGNQYFADGGTPFAGYYGGPTLHNYMKEGTPMYNFGGYFPQGPRFEEGGKMPQWLAEARFKASGSENQMGRYGYAEGGAYSPDGRGLVNSYATGGQTMDGRRMGMINIFEDGGLIEGQVLENVDDDMLRKLKKGGYTYKIID